MEILGSYPDDGIPCLSFVGDFDTMDVAAFEAHVDDVRAAGSSNLIVDATEMRLINSSAIQGLLRAQAALAEEGGALIIAGLSPFATSVFQTLGIDLRIQCVATADEARARFRAT